MKVVFVFDHFGPYHDARVGSAASCPDWEVVGIELHPTSRTYGWLPNNLAKPFKKISLPKTDLLGRAERRALRPHLEQVLGNCAPDVLFVNGWGDFMSIETILWAKRHGVRLVFMSETRRRDGGRSCLGEAVKRRIVSMGDAGFCGGESHRRYLVELGLAKENVALGYNAVDNEFFSKIQKEKKFSAFRVQFSRSNGETAQTQVPYFLASNRFVERKNLARLIRAYAKYAESFQFSACSFQESGGGVWPLVLLGDGELRGELEGLCEELAMKAFSFRGSVFSREKEGDLKLNSYKLNTPAGCGLVVFAGFRQVEELPAFYAGAGAFVHPALEEPWGLVINEAMASGLPVISSRNVGAAEELVVEGKTGFLFDPENNAEMTAAMLKMVEMPRVDREAMGEASLRVIAEWAPERFAQGAQEAARAAISAPLKRLRIVDRVLLEILIRK